MKLSILLAIAAACAGGAEAYWKGFNIGANNPDGSCKSQLDWERDFKTIANLPGHFTSVRLYASSDCDTLARAVPAALNTGTTLLVGVWTEDTTHFENEKKALLEAVQQYGHDWIIAVSVGSEDLYRRETDASTLASQIYDVRGMMGALGAGSVEVGHVDTWTAWVDPANSAVIQACDFLGMDGYPYFQDASIQDANDVFWASVNNVRAVSQGRWVWLTESGWPVSGGTLGAAVPSVANAQVYWWEVMCQTCKSSRSSYPHPIRGGRGVWLTCWTVREMHSFVYTLQDYTSSPSFGVVDQNFNPLYDLSC
jgi:glucan endo-1,3-beta-D-glucosidase